VRTVFAWSCPQENIRVPHKIGCRTVSAIREQLELVICLWEENKGIIGILLFSIIFIGGAYFVLSSGKPQPVIVIYTSQDKEKPITQATESFYDLGKIKVADSKISGGNVAK